MPENIQEQNLLTAQTARDLKRIIRKVDSIQGPRVINRPDSIWIGDAPQPPAQRPVQQAGGGLTKGTQRYQVLQMVTDTQEGWDWVRYH
jgi:hypothetical protein